jgi:hypothetical protein
MEETSMKVVTGLLVGALIGGFCVTGAEAGSNFGAALLGSAGPITAKTNCTSMLKPSCAEMVANYSGTPGDNAAVGVYVGLDGTGCSLTAVDFGIQYDAGMPMMINSWTNCGDLEAPTGGSPWPPAWPASGSGNTVVWGECKTGNAVLVGFFSVYIYAGGRLTLTEHPTYTSEPTTGARVLDCQSNFDALKKPAIIALNGGGGANPACEVPVTRTTWGQVKSLYQN